MAVTHIAGFVISIDGRSIQRCALCGAKLGDTKRFEREAWCVTASGERRRMTIEDHVEYPPGDLIRFETEQSIGVIVEQLDTRPAPEPGTERLRLPDDLCLDLVEGD